MKKKKSYKQYKSKKQFIGIVSLYSICISVILVTSLIILKSSGFLNFQTYAALGTQGLQPGAPIDNSGNINFTDQTADQIAQTGAGWVKFNFRLGLCYQDWTTVGCNGVTALQQYDKIVDSALAKGLKVFGLISNESWPGGREDWDANNAEAAGGNGDNTYVQNYSKQAAILLAQHYAGKISMWELWNEPNLEGTYFYPSNFAWLLSHVYTDAKAAGLTGVQFISGGITCQQDSSNNITSASSGADYLTNTYKQGKNLAGWDTIKTNYGSYPLDGIGEHIYIDGSTRTNSGRVKSCLNLIYKSYTAYEGSNTPKQVYITEFGWETDLVSEKIQATNLQTSYVVFKKTPYVKTAYWFFLQDETWSQLYYGLLRPDSSKKPSWTSYQTYANY